MADEIVEGDIVTTRGANTWAVVFRNKISFNSWMSLTHSRHVVWYHEFASSNSIEDGHLSYLIIKFNEKLEFKDIDENTYDMWPLLSLEVNEYTPFSISERHNQTRANAALSVQETSKVRIDHAVFTQQLRNFTIQRTTYWRLYMCNARSSEVMPARIDKVNLCFQQTLHLTIFGYTAPLIFWLQVFIPNNPSYHLGYDVSSVIQPASLKWMNIKAWSFHMRIPLRLWSGTLAELAEFMFKRSESRVRTMLSDDHANEGESLYNVPRSWENIFFISAREEVSNKDETIEKYYHIYWNTTYPLLEIESSKYIDPRKTILDCFTTQNDTLISDVVLEYNPDPLYYIIHGFIEKCKYVYFSSYKSDEFRIFKTDNTISEKERYAYVTKELIRQLHHVEKFLKSGSIRLNKPVVPEYDETDKDEVHSIDAACQKDIEEEAIVVEENKRGPQQDLSEEAIRKAFRVSLSESLPVVIRSVSEYLIRKISGRVKAYHQCITTSVNNTIAPIKQDIGNIQLSNHKIDTSLNTLMKEHGDIKELLVQIKQTQVDKLSQVSNNILQLNSDSLGHFGVVERQCETAYDQTIYTHKSIVDNSQVINDTKESIKDIK
jgi:hypothetical protein